MSAPLIGLAGLALAIPDVRHQVGLALLGDNKVIVNDPEQVIVEVEKEVYPWRDEVDAEVMGYPDYISWNPVTITGATMDTQRDHLHPGAGPSINFGVDINNIDWSSSSALSILASASEVREPDSRYREVLTPQGRMYHHTGSVYSTFVNNDTNLSAIEISVNVRPTTLGIRAWFTHFGEGSRVPSISSQQLTFSAAMLLHREFGWPLVINYYHNVGSADGNLYEPSSLDFHAGMINRTYLSNDTIDYYSPLIYDKHYFILSRGALEEGEVYVLLPSHPDYVEHRRL
jgi:hypothetical protein